MSRTRNVVRSMAFAALMSPAGVRVVGAGQPPPMTALGMETASLGIETASLVDPREMKNAMALDLDSDRMEHLRHLEHADGRHAMPDAELDQERDERQYDRGTKALDDRQWDRAIEAFGQVIAAKGARADGALYWTAWAQHKQGSRSEALSTLERLRSTFPNSRWINEARALDVEIRQASGQRVQPENEPDEDLKLMALNGLMQSDSEAALPMLEKFLRGADSPKLKERALFVLAQSGSAKARELLAEVARGNRNPDLQERAVHYLGIFGGTENRRLLQEIYASAPSVDVKRKILRSFMVAGERDRLLAVAKSESVVDLRSEAVRQLGVMGAQDELSQLYQNESSSDVKKQILQAMFVGGGADRLIELARTEKDAELRRTAVRNLGLIGARRTGDALVAIYSSERDPQIRRTVIDALFIQSNAGALVDLARKEADPEMKKQIVGKLSLMKSKEATDYLMELLVKP